ncbi:Translin, partial [Crepidotus variabilis]
MMASIQELSPANTIVTVFDGFRENLDEFYDRRERLIKAGRDITNLSKKVIFLLHRLALEIPGQNESDDAVRHRAAHHGYEKLREIQGLYAKMQPELQQERFWRHQRQVSPGVQEYIEALSFAHYLDHGTLITLDEVQRTLMDSQGKEYFPLTISDYLLGLSDLTGELMRIAISGIARRGGRVHAKGICAFVRECKAVFERFTPYIGELRKKQAVTTQSLEKIEDATYAIMVRGSEYDLPPERLDDIVAQFIANFGQGGGHDSSRARRGGGAYFNEEEDD